MRLGTLFWLAVMGGIGYWAVGYFATDLEKMVDTVSHRPERTASEPAKPPEAPPQSATDAVGTPSEAADKPAEKQAKLRLPYDRNTNPEPEAASAEGQEQEPLRTEPFRRAVAIGTDTLKAGEKTVILADIEGLEADHTCPLENGKSWPCGRSGRSALRRLIRGRTVSCDVFEDIDEHTVRARCSVGKTELGKWVVRYGWAVPGEGAGTELRMALETARTEERGQWQTRFEAAN